MRLPFADVADDAYDWWCCCCCCRAAKSASPSPTSPFLYIYIDDNNFNVADIVCLRCALTGQIDRQPNWQTIYQAHTHTQQRSRMCKENKLDYPQPRFFGIAALVLLAFAIIFRFVLCQFAHTLCLMAFIVAWQYAYRRESVCSHTRSSYGCWLSRAESRQTGVFSSQHQRKYIIHKYINGKKWNWRQRERKSIRRVEMSMALWLLEHIHTTQQAIYSRQAATTESTQTQTHPLFVSCQFCWCWWWMDVEWTHYRFCCWYQHLPNTHTERCCCSFKVVA